MARLFEILEKACGALRERAVRRGDPAAREDPAQPIRTISTRAAARHRASSLGHEPQALAAFKAAAAIAPQSPDVRTYLALHYARGKDWQQAVPMLERVVAETPDRVPAVEALAVMRERQGGSRKRCPAAEDLTLRAPTAAELVRIGELAMQLQQTPLAIESFEKARALTGSAFAQRSRARRALPRARRFADARDALDRVPASHPDYPMALFKRAQVSVLLNEPDSAARIAQARARRTRRRGS